MNGADHRAIKRSTASVVRLARDAPDDLDARIATSAHKGAAAEIGTIVGVQCLRQSATGHEASISRSFSQAVLSWTACSKARFVDRRLLHREMKSRTIRVKTFIAKVIQGRPIGSRVSSSTTTTSTRV